MAMDAGIIGLGIMGSAMAGNLLAAGHSVIGYDIDETARAKLQSAGGTVATSAGDVAAHAPIVLLSPSSKAFRDVTDDICAKGARGCIVVECSTLPIEDKLVSRDALADHGIILIDCPVSGTGAQAVEADLVMLASGDRQAVEKCRPIFDAMSRETHYLGEFGNGMKMKFVANLLVSIHNVAAAEALVLAQKAGLPEPVRRACSRCAVR